ncbi:MAG: 2Fe-2S iron-sulfur cluster binding domain-containing protein [Paenibacillus sp.]|uniref:2Fe-2S iron-sulfur cluster-binding protein n=1 Tax=Paenibacillus sp. TaxID=58172 RepID=UPI0025D340A4|nr:2Fe-2S iron-sulfur cluster-binding protein [Paenibacillus sp.]MBR2563216.1 2Fe-2S iron-sulfur cluster binding domain-containing protein [Paenibacillus sp.]
MQKVITFLPMNKSISVQSGTTILQAARRVGVRIPTRCDGKAACLMCKVKVGQDDLHALLPPTEAEKRKLGQLLEEGIRLSCQAKVCGQLSVHIPEDPLKAAIRKQLERQQQEDDWFA